MDIIETNLFTFKVFIFTFTFIIVFIGYILYSYFYSKWFIDYNLYSHANLIKDNRVK